MYILYIQSLHYTSDNEAGKSHSTFVNRNKFIGKTPTIWNNPKKEQKQNLLLDKNGVREKNISATHE